MSEMYTPLTLADLEPGMVILGQGQSPSKSKREILSITGHQIAYKITWADNASDTSRRMIGRVYKCSVAAFLKWAIRDVNEEAA
jgi:hypothetical protein